MEKSGKSVSHGKYVRRIVSKLTMESGQTCMYYLEGLAHYISY